MRTGPLSLSVNQAGGFLKSDPGQANPNIQLYFNPLSYEIPKNGSQGSAARAVLGVPAGLLTMPAAEQGERGNRIQGMRTMRR